MTGSSLENLPDPDECRTETEPSLGTEMVMSPEVELTFIEEGTIVLRIVWFPDRLFASIV